MMKNTDENLINLLNDSLKILMDTKPEIDQPELMIMRFFNELYHRANNTSENEKNLNDTVGSILDELLTQHIPKKDTRTMSNIESLKPLLDFVLEKKELWLSKDTTFTNMEWHQALTQPQPIQQTPSVPSPEAPIRPSRFFLFIHDGLARINQNLAKKMMPQSHTWVQWNNRDPSPVHSALNVSPTFANSTLQGRSGSQKLRALQFSRLPGRVLEQPSIRNETKKTTDPNKPG